MRFMGLAVRNFKEMYRDPVSISLAIGLPLVLQLIFHPIGRFSDFFTPTILAPGIVLFAFCFITFGSGMILARDRDSALFSRLLTAPLRARDFIAAYSLPFIPIAIIQMLLVFAVAALLGLEIVGSAGLVFLFLFIMSIGYIGLGMIMGSIFTEKQLGGFFAVIVLITTFGGAWMELEIFGGVFQSIMLALPFAHALDGARDVMINGTGFSGVAIDFYWVLGYTIVFFALGTFLFRRKMVE